MTSVDVDELVADRDALLVLLTHCNPSDEKSARMADAAFQIVNRGLDISRLPRAVSRPTLGEALTRATDLQARGRERFADLVDLDELPAVTR